VPRKELGKTGDFAAPTCGLNDYQQRIACSQGKAADSIARGANFEDNLRFCPVSAEVL
jgi:hypothetical protein